MDGKHTSRIVVVAGCGRCGSSLLMRMLHAGGIECFADNHDSFEHPVVMQLPRRTEWLKDVVGKAVKVLDPERSRLPTRCDWSYDFIWLSRNHYEQAKSQAKILRVFNGFHLNASHMHRLERSLERDNRRVPEWLRLNYCAKGRSSRILRMRFEKLIRSPRESAEQVAAFLTSHGILNTEAMAGQVVPREVECLDGLLELVLTKEPR